MRFSDFVKAYNQFLARSNTAISEDDSERVETFYETDWVQFLFVQTSNDNARVKLVIELSLPGWVSELSMNRITPQSSTDHTTRLRIILKEFANHLKYLLKLSEAGFQLGIIAEEGFWSAWILLTGPPSKQLFTVIFPPTIST